MDSMTHTPEIGHLALVSGEAPAAAIDQPPPTPPASTKPPRTTSTIANGIVTLTPGGTFALADIPPERHADLAAHGLRALLIAAKEPRAAFAKLVNGEAPGRKPPVAKEPKGPRPLSSARQAYAITLAEQRAKAEGIQRAVGKNQTAEFTALLAECAERAKLVDGKILRDAARNSRFIEHLNRIEGKSVELV